MTEVVTPQGRVVGTRAGDLHVFRGVPFAVAERFRPPQPPPHQSTIDATTFGPPAAQNPDKLDRIWGEVLAPGDENCLTLNVWTPDPGGPPKPVLVWVHGGAFLIGSGRWPYANPAALARRGLVVVSVNYRLGAFGFLDLRDHGPEFAASANLGLLDVVRALEWVRENIAHFGGDPTAVTVGGQSAGAILTGCVLAAPRAKGLFRRAILMSGGPNLVRSGEFARDVTRRFLTFAGAKTAADLRAKPTAELLAAQHALMRSTDFGDPQFAPTVDGDVLPDWPLKRIAAGSAADVTLLAGSTRDEFRLWGLYVPPLRNVPAAALRAWLPRVVGDRAAALLAAYRTPSRTGPEQLFAVFGDFMFRLPTLRVAEAQAAHRSDTRAYRFDWPTPAGGGWMGSPHSLDTAILFGNFDVPGVELITGTGADRVALHETMADTWAAFVATGDPSHAGLPAWPTYDLSTRPTMLLDGAQRVASDPAAAERAAWDGVPFDGSHPAVTNLPRKAELLRYMLGRLAARVAVVLAVAVGVAALIWWAVR